MMPILIATSVLFLSGLTLIVTRRNMVAALLGIELMLNAGAVNFATFATFNGGNVEGYVMSVFIIALAAVETVVALSIVFAIRRLYATDDMDQASVLRG